MTQDYRSEDGVEQRGKKFIAPGRSKRTNTVKINNDGLLFIAAFQRSSKRLPSLPAEFA